MCENGSLPDPQLKKDFDAIISVIKKMVDDCGARENLFRLEGKISKRFRFVLNKDEGGELGHSVYIASEFRIRFLLSVMEESKRSGNTKMILFCWI